MRSGARTTDHLTVERAGLRSCLANAPLTANRSRASNRFPFASLQQAVIRRQKEANLRSLTAKRCRGQDHRRRGLCDDDATDVQVLAPAQSGLSVRLLQHSAQVDWSTVDVARRTLDATNALLDPDQADVEGIRLTLPDPLEP